MKAEQDVTGPVETPSKNARAASPGRRWLGRIPALLILGFLSFRFFQLHNFKAPKQVDMASLHLKNLDGAPLDTSIFRDRAVVLNFWAPWCPPCKLETPWLQHLQEAHPSDLVVIGVVADPGQYPQARSFMASHGVTYPLAQETASVDEVIGGIVGLPTTLYISRSGQVVHTATGITPQPLMEHYVREALK